MPRVTDAEVFAIIDTTLTDIDVFINTANMMVTSWLETAGLTDETLKEIERYLVAHVLSVNDPRAKSMGISGAPYESYQGQWGKGLEGTSYGQMAILLDTSGTLNQIAKDGYKKSASLNMIGYH